MAVSTPGPIAAGQAKLHNRKNVAKLDAAQLAAFRTAISASKGLQDDRGFQHWAGIHGLPLPMYCQHGTDLFLPWHRAYLYFFELSLQDQDATVSLPYWDWTSAASHAQGIPAAYSDAQAGGSPNPLAGTAINDVARTQFANSGGGPAPQETARQPGPPGQLPTAAHVQATLALSDFLDFSHQVEDIHNGVHVWVGGTMSEIPLAAYDPVFFAHHAMIDRLWRLWQLQHPAAAPPASLLDEALPPFRMTVRQTLSVTALGYDYASSTRHVPAGG